MRKQRKWKEKKNTFSYIVRYMRASEWKWDENLPILKTIHIFFIEIAEHGESKV